MESAEGIKTAPSDEGAVDVGIVADYMSKGSMLSTGWPTSDR